MRLSTLLFPLVAGLSFASLLPKSKTWTDSDVCYDAKCIMSTEKLYHVKLFYNRKEGITPEEFNKYWAYEHAEKAKNFHVRIGVVRYNQVGTSTSPSRTSILT
jgi:hypothetical protein